MMRIKVIKLALYLVVWFPKWVGEPDYVFGDNPCDNLQLLQPLHQEEAVVADVLKQQGKRLMLR